MKSKGTHTEEMWRLIQRFEEENPELVKAMKLFDISIVEYERMVQNLSVPQIYESSSSMGNPVSV
jgi:hypothetical protein